VEKLLKLFALSLKVDTAGKTKEKLEAGENASLLNCLLNVVYVE